MVRNEWELAFLSQIPVMLDLEAGAGHGNLDFTGVQLQALRMQLGAGDFVVSFHEPNRVEMSRLRVDAGASRLEMVGIGHASPSRMRVTAGISDITLDLGGEWSRPSEISITAGVGAITVRVPEHPGVRIDTERGLTNLDASGLRRSGDGYVNDAWGDTDTELRVEISAGIGQIRLVSVSDD